MKQRFLRTAAVFLSLILLTSCSIPTQHGSDSSSSGKTARSSSAPEEQAVSEDPSPANTSAEAVSSAVPEDIRVAGLSLKSHTVYTVYLEPTESCAPTFTPVYVTMEFESANNCLLTYEGKRVSLGRFNNQKYIDLFSLSEDVSQQIAINGKCDTNCSGADFAIRVSSFIQGENAVALFGDQPVGNPVPVFTEPKGPVTLRAGKQTITTGETYRFRITPDENCDKTFDSFTIPIDFYSELGAFLVFKDEKEKESVFPVDFLLEDNGWFEITAVNGSVWGMIGEGTDGTDLSFHVYGLTKNPANLFKNLSAKQQPVQEPTQAPTEVPTQVPTPTQPPATEPAEEPIQPANYDTDLYYYYGLLDTKEKVIYTQLTEAYRACEKTVALAYPISNEDFYRIREYLRYDQPDLFWINANYSTTYSKGLVTKVQLSYNELADHLSTEQAKVEAAVQKILSKTKGLRPAEAERYVHDTIVADTVYVAGCPYNQTLYSTLVNKQTVCAGYSRAFQYLMQRLNIPCYYCVGYSGSSDSMERHAWNIIQIDGGWYNVDVTWDDKLQEGWAVDFISYEYYNVTDSSLSVEHSRREAGLLLPACNATKASFDKLYGHSWKEEIAAAGGYLVVNTIDDYSKYCYNAMMKTGMGTTVTRFILTGDEIYNRIAELSRANELKNGYLNTFWQASKLKNCYYSYSYRCYSLSSRQNCYYIEVTHKVEQR